jgi:hypothetical protein
MNALTRPLLRLPERAPEDHHSMLAITISINENGESQSMPHVTPHNS